MSGQHQKILKLAFQDQIGFLFDTYLSNSLTKMVTGLDISQNKEKKIPYEESQFKNRHINAENKVVVAREKRGRAMAEQVKGIQRDKLPVMKVTTRLCTRN